MNPFKVNGKFNLRKMLISIAISEGVGLLSGFLTRGGMEVYKNLKQPSFAPPSWLFGVVWPVLYFLMGFASYRIWMYASQKAAEVKNALFYYGAQLAFNFLWSILFFRYGLRGLAFFDLLVLITFVIITLILFYRIDKLAGYLLIPYLLWIIYAAFLNFFVWQLNR